MILQPYGPIEEAIQKSISPATASPKTSHIFLWGVITTLLSGFIVLLIVKNKKEDKKQALERSYDLGILHVGMQELAISSMLVPDLTFPSLHPNT